MNYSDKIDIIMHENLTQTGFNIWMSLKKRIPDIWSRPSSSSGKYHKREDGSVRTIAEHTFEMLYACVKIIHLFPFEILTEESDIIFLVIGLHDSMKYGFNPESKKHTAQDHDKLIADQILNIKEQLCQHYSKRNVDLLEEGVRFHAGRFSTDAKNIQNFDIGKLNSITMFVHFLDMMSSKNCIKITDFIEEI